MAADGGGIGGPATVSHMYFDGPFAIAGSPDRAELIADVALRRAACFAAFTQTPAPVTMPTTANRMANDTTVRTTDAADRATSVTAATFAASALASANSRRSAEIRRARGRERQGPEGRTTCPQKRHVMRLTWPTCPAAGTGTWRLAPQLVHVWEIRSLSGGIRTRLPDL